MKNGPYVLVIAPLEYPGKKYRGRYIYEHHLVWWKKTGQIVGKGFLIHHKNEDKRDNDPDNLEKLTVAKHTSLHAPEAEKMTILCGFCHEPFTRLSRVLKRQIKKSKYPEGTVFCGRSCQVKEQRRIQKIAK